jgi:hypothetical protein
MASYKELLYFKSSEINDRAREQEISGRGSMNKVETIAALADEDMSQDLIQTLDQTKAELVDVADDMGLSTEGSKADIQMRVAEASITGSGGDTFPNSGTDGDARKPMDELESHFETSETRREEIIKAAHEALDKALAEGQSYTVLESMRPKDATEPLGMQPSYMKHHPDEIPVVEITVPHLAFRLHKAERNPTRL